MLSVGMLAPGDEDYVLSVADGHPPVTGDQGGRQDEYYTKGAEPPGVWMGGGSGALGLAGQVDPADLRLVLAAIDPRTGLRMLSPAAMATRTRPGLYLTFSAPKGVSLIGLLGEDAVASQVLAGHRAAVEAALGHIEREALFARRGHAGEVRIATGGFVAAGFQHTTSRAGDPQLHTHVLAANLVQGVDGSWSAPDSRSLFRHARTAGFVYQAALRAELTARLGLRWRPVRNGMAEPAGISARVLREFSTRRRKIEERLAERGSQGGRSAQVAANATRAPKDHHVTASVLRQSWRLQAAEAGLGPDQLRSLLGPARQPDALRAGLEQATEELLGPAGLTAHASSFERRDVLRAVAELAGDGAAPLDVEHAADRLLADPRVVPLTPATGPAPGPDQGRWTTADLLAVEQTLLASALRRRDEPVASVPDGHLERVLADRPTLGGEQTAAVTALVGRSGGVAVLVGRAGTGKTFALDAARAAWQSAGHVVVGAAPSARAAAELQAGSGIVSTTLARLLIEADRPGPEGGLPWGGVVVVDEAGMAGTRTIGRLLSMAERCGTKVVLVGDPGQLPAIEAGGTLLALASRLDAVELVDNRRQVQAWERAALVDLRAGRATEALAVYRRHGRLVLSESAPDARLRMVADWWAARTDGETAAMFALRRSDVEHLNALARMAMRADGRLGDVEIEAADRAFAVGDEVVALRNDRRLGVINGTRATVAAIDPAGGSLTVVTDAGGQIELPADYLEAGHLDHGYALTVHKGQGATYDRALLLGSDSLYREAGYVGMSRGRQRNDLYVVAAPDDPDAHTHLPRRGREPDGHTDGVDHLGVTLARSRSQALAVDTGLPGPGAAVTLAELDRGFGDLASGPPDRRAEWGPRLRRAFEERRQLLVRAALADPGPHLVDRLGPLPPAGLARARWARAAEAVEAYRDRWDVTGRSALGPEPVGAAQRAERDHARALLDEACRHLEPERDGRDTGIGR